MKLWMPDTYKKASAELKKRVCNGCGPAGLIGKLVPEKILGIDISEACNIHDWMYNEGVDKQKADIYFLANMVLLCYRGNKWLMWLRAPLAVKYFLAVFTAGDEYFDKG